MVVDKPIFKRTFLHHLSIKLQIVVESLELVVVFAITGYVSKIVAFSLISLIGTFNIRSRCESRDNSRTFDMDLQG